MNWVSFKKQSVFSVCDAMSIEKIGKGIDTKFTKQGKKVLFLHNPKTAGTSLRMFLGTEGFTHAFPRDCMNKTAWNSNFIVCAVRHPISRFISSYNYHTSESYQGILIKQFGEVLKEVTPTEYFYMLKDTVHLAPQINWVRYGERVSKKIDLLLRFEDIENWTEILSSTLEIDINYLPKLNVGRSIKWSGKFDEYTKLDNNEEQELLSVLSNYYENDFQILGYRKDIEL